VKPVGRGMAVAALLRAGWSPGAVSAGLQVANRGGTPDQALNAMQKATKAERRERFLGTST